MEKVDACMGISTEEIRRAADELTSCVKRLRYSSAALRFSKDRLRAAGVKGEYISRLSRQLDFLRSDVYKTEIMALVLHRIADESELMENSVLDHEDELHQNENSVEICDLSRLSELVGEVTGKR